MMMDSEIHKKFDEYRTALGAVGPSATNLDAKIQAAAILTLADEIKRVSAALTLDARKAVFDELSSVKVR